MPKLRKSAKKFMESEQPAQVVEEKAVQPVETPVESPSEPEPPRLTSDEMKELQILNFALRCFAAERELATMKRDELLKIIDPKGALRQFAGTIQHLTSEHNDSMGKMARLVNNIKERLGVDLKEYTYNEETGILQKLSDQT